MTRKMARRKVFVLLTVLVLLLVAGCGSQGQESPGTTPTGTETTTSSNEPIVVKWNLVAAPGTFLAMVAEKTKETVEADPDLKDRVKMQLYYAGQLFKPEEGLNAVMRGEVQMAQQAEWYLTSLDPALGRAMIPFTFENLEEVIRFYNSPELEREIAKPLEDRGLRLVAAYPSGGSYMLLTKNKEVKVPKDVKGLKVRTQADFAEIWQSLGAAPVNMSANDIYVALQRNMIDAADINPSSIHDRKLYEQGHYLLNMMFHGLSLYEVANKTWWDGLPSDVRDKLEQHLNEAARLAQDRSLREEKEYLEEFLPQNGVTVYTPTPEEVAMWREAIEPAAQKMAAQMGGRIELGK